MTFDQFVALYARQVQKAVIEGQRQGQYAVNLLREVRPDLATRMVGDWEFDPFNQDGRLPAFWYRLADLWEALPAPGPLTRNVNVFDCSNPECPKFGKCGGECARNF